MHEASLAADIWESVAKAAREHDARRVKAIKLEIGILNMIEEEQLTFWLSTLAERDGSPEVVVKITLIPGRLRCDDCGMESTFPEQARSDQEFLPVIAPTNCVSCGSPKVTIVGGREIRVVSAEVKTDKE